MEFLRNGNPEDIYNRDGGLQTLLSFAGGFYTAGRLSLRGDFPPSIEGASVGRPLTHFVDHPAFRASTIIVTEAEASQGSLALVHDVRSVSVEEAERRWAVARDAMPGSAIAA